jgi:pyruvate dehydrogenase E1 component alpha subunit
MVNWNMKKLKEFESTLAIKFERGEINCPLHLCGGNEENLLTIFSQIKKDDWVFSTHRNHYHALLKGVPQEQIIDEVLNKKGTMRSMNFCSPKHNFISSAIVAGNCALAVGVALALKKEKSKSKVWCFCGDGAEDSGHFMEAVRFGLARRLPLTFVVEDNDFSTDSTKKDRWHNDVSIQSLNIVRYEYKRIYPHVGIGKHVTF